MVSRTACLSKVWPSCSAQRCWDRRKSPTSPCTWSFRTRLWSSYSTSSKISSQPNEITQWKQRESNHQHHPLMFPSFLQRNELLQTVYWEDINCPNQYFSLERIKTSQQKRICTSKLKVFLVPPKSREQKAEGIFSGYDQTDLIKKDKSWFVKVFCVRRDSCGVLSKI